MLVSVIVVSYNSEHFIIDCLNSIYEQDYDQIELIISDDCSTDNTIPVVKNWISLNYSRFIKCVLLESDTNNGVSANCNKGVKVSNGQWIKLIAADDYLYKTNAISTYIKESAKSNNKIIFARIVELSGDIKIPQNDEITSLMKIVQSNSSTWLEYALLNNFIKACSQFIEKETFVKLGCFDERIRNVEDAPMWIKYSTAGLAFTYIDIPLVVYRKHIDSLVSQYKSGVNIKYYEDILKLYELYRIPNSRGLLKVYSILISKVLEKFILGYKSNCCKKHKHIYLRAFKFMSGILNIYRKIKCNIVMGISTLKVSVQK